ncbi:bifunctional adenosylcobinamide kinase/adenosylcobinamide-phosphate guanylyltransferase [uncultured Thiodictyon sp.]|uniref:bifunctional adenosylcobinamide kinase/adenosylcobinamide-phosphate guanylyltransferase n=1 Tax=uncultured Thiodictyon sp. TaxID=1846217 RepID=UPI0025DDAAEA|nr:bifunctional adenosylcobinamide kinase/adenosylcobinamide-phosphate guanylyltransferase [uncultured Thiodictyon sp.]
MSPLAPAGHTLVLGGVRSGKSRFAERLALDCGQPVTYLATARAGDAAMARRIAEHQRRRPADWCLVEEPLALAERLAEAAAAGRCCLVECLTLWLTNLLMEADADRTEREIQALLGVVASAPGRVILVGNESNLGVTPLGELSRRYCDLAGTLHQQLAARCARVVLIVAGLPLMLKGTAA